MLKKMLWAGFLFSPLALAAPSESVEFFNVQLPSFQPVMNACGQVFAKPWIMQLSKTVKASQANFKAEVAAIIKYDKKCKELVAANRLQQYRAEAQPFKDAWQAANQKYLTAPEHAGASEKMSALLAAAKALSEGREDHKGLKDWIPTAKQCVSALWQFDTEEKRAEEARVKNFYKACKEASGS